MSIYLSFIKPIFYSKFITHYDKIINDMEKDLTNNPSYYKDLDTNFKLACELSDREYSHDELLNLLQNGNIPQKQIAALKFDSINDLNDAKALLSNLTGCDGKIREAVALKLNTLLCENKKTQNIIADISAEKLADATIDINANICRLVVDSAIILKKYDNFAKTYTEKIINFTEDALAELDKFIFRDKKYVINKQLFKLYWCLEALSEFYEYTNEEALKNIIEKCANQQEYTIREKTAQIIVKTNKFPHIKNKLENDENYYVRQILHHPSLL